MPDDIIRQYTPEETAAKREALLRDSIAPAVARVFAVYPFLNSAVFSVAQYWDDEAGDAVHDVISFSLFETPDIDAFWARELEADDLDGWEFLEGRTTAAAFGLTDPEDYKALFDFDDRIDDLMSDELESLWSRNDRAIALFAAFCKEGGDQNETFAHDYAPFAIFRRDAAGTGVTTEIIGTMHRPWLDGVASQRSQPRQD